MRILSTTLLSVILVLTLISLKSDKKYYNEINRPQFHFSPKKNWQGAPAGLLFYNGDYQMFYQYNPKGLDNTTLNWGHTVSKDLTHWKHLPIALSPNRDSTDKENCTIFSGSAIVDEHNLLGKQSGDDKTLILFYTAINCGQHIAYSVDRGKSWTKLEQNPIIQFDENDAARDPKVIWHEPSKKWIMLLYRKTGKKMKTQGISFYTSDNLIDWEWKSHLHGFSGTPDLVELQVTNRPEEKKWILFDSNGSYLIGDFDGETFSPKSPKMKSDYGKNYYAAQTLNNSNDGRIIQIAWMRGGKFPEMPFNGQMSFPSELSLTKLNTGYKLIRKPIKEIEQLHGKHYKWEDKDLIPGLDENKVKRVSGDCLHIIGDFDIKTSDNFGFMIRHGKKDPGIEVLYNVKRGTLSALGSTVPLMPIDNHIKLEILLDRTSLEIYANDGQAVVSNCYVSDKKSDKIVLYTNGGELGITKLDIYKMKTVWRDE
jgi:sucrose-6-phosphate hydrolase SacC (GH32 family)